MLQVQTVQRQARLQAFEAHAGQQHSPPHAPDTPHNPLAMPDYPSNEVQNHLARIVDCFKMNSTIFCTADTNVSLTSQAWPLC